MVKSNRSKYTTKGKLIFKRSEYVFHSKTSVFLITHIDITLFQLKNFYIPLYRIQNDFKTANKLCYTKIQLKWFK